jgi:hypothetical protein
MVDRVMGRVSEGGGYSDVLLWWVYFITRSNIWLYMSVKASFMSTKIR